jgi:uncharacterized protein (TIGR04222 family)
MLTTATTWGITSTQFLFGYGALCVVAAIVIWRRWRRAVAPPEHGGEHPQPELDLFALAMLGGGPQLALTSALTRMHDDGLLRVRRREATLKAAGVLPRTADPLERAVYEAVSAEPGISSNALRARLVHDEAIRSMSARLESAGLLIDEDEARRFGRLWLVGVALVALGVARIFAGWSNDAAVEGVIAMVLVVAFATVWLARQRPIATVRGRELLARRREERDDLRRHAAKGEGAMAVALFGGGALWLADPAIASALGVPREEEAQAGWHAGGGGAGTGGGTCASNSGGDLGGGGGCGGGGCGGGGN